MIHVEEEATKLIAEWKANGFNGVHMVDCYMEPCRWDDWEGDGKTREEFEAFRAGYACFVAAPDLWPGFSSYQDDSPYSKREIDWFGCYDDMIAEIKKRLGDDVVVNHRSGCNEFECQRKA
jgi:hypothetical protein